MSKTADLITEATALVHELMATLLKIQPTPDQMTEDELRKFYALYTDLFPVIGEYLQVIGTPRDVFCAHRGSAVAPTDYQLLRQGRTKPDARGDRNAAGVRLAEFGPRAGGSFHS